MTVTQPARPAPSTAGRARCGNSRDRPPPDPAAVGEDAQQDEEREQRARDDVAERGADRERARQQQLRLRLDERPAWSRKSSIWSSVKPERPVDEVLPELLDRLDRAGLHRRPLPRDLPHGEPEAVPPRSRGCPTTEITIASHRGKRWRSIQPKAGHSSARDEDRDEQRDDEQLELDDEPDADADGGGDDEESPGVGGGDAEAVRDGVGLVGRDDPAPIPEGVEQRTAWLFVGAAHPASLGGSHSADVMRCGERLGADDTGCRRPWLGFRG